MIIIVIFFVFSNVAIAGEEEEVMMNHLLMAELLLSATAAARGTSETMTESIKMNKHQTSGNNVLHIVGDVSCWCGLYK